MGLKIFFFYLHNLKINIRYTWENDSSTKSIGSTGACDIIKMPFFGKCINWLPAFHKK